MNKKIIFSLSLLTLFFTLFLPIDIVSAYPYSSNNYRYDAQSNNMMKMNSDLQYNTLSYNMMNINNDWHIQYYNYAYRKSYTYNRPYYSNNFHYSTNYNVIYAKPYIVHHQLDCYFYSFNDCADSSLNYYENRQTYYAYG